MKKAGVKNIPSTKIEISYNKIQRMTGLDDIARILFPGNRNHQKVFLAIFIELKYAPRQFLPSLLPLCDKYKLSPRMLETVRSKMRRMGMIDHVCRFNSNYGYREGWVFSMHLKHSLSKLTVFIDTQKQRKGFLQKIKDEDAVRYI